MWMSSRGSLSSGAQGEMRVTCSRRSQRHAHAYLCVCECMGRGTELSGGCTWGLSYFPTPAFFSQSMAGLLTPRVCLPFWCQNQLTLSFREALKGNEQRSIPGVGPQEQAGHRHRGTGASCCRTGTRLLPSWRASPWGSPRPALHTEWETACRS